MENSDYDKGLRTPHKYSREERIHDLFYNFETFQLSGVIESATPVENSTKYIESLQQEFKDVLEQPIYAKEIDPELEDLSECVG